MGVQLLLQHGNVESSGRSGLNLVQTLPLLSIYRNIYVNTRKREPSILKCTYQPKIIWLNEKFLYVINTSHSVRTGVIYFECTNGARYGFRKPPGKGKLCLSPLLWGGAAQVEESPLSCQCLLLVQPSPGSKAGVMRREANACSLSSGRCGN